MKSLRNTTLAKLLKWDQPKNYVELQDLAINLMLIITVIAGMFSYILAYVLPEVYAVLAVLPLLVGAIIMMRPTLRGKHWYVKAQIEQRYSYTERVCAHCGKRIALNDNQLVSMSVDMAFCSQGQKMSILAILFGSTNCRG